MIKPEIKFVKTHYDAVLPSFNHSDYLLGDSGADLFTIKSVNIPSKGSAVAPVGLTVAWVTPGYWYRIEAKSGLGFKHNIFPHFGIIDNMYRGDLGIKLYNFGTKNYVFNKGDKVAQIVMYKLIQPTFSWTKEISKSERGSNGLGSSGR